MALFQHSIIKKYVGELDKVPLEAAWQRFQQHFHNTDIQQNILHAKEEEYQEGFVRDLFVNVLGYTLKPQPEYNFVLEQKSTSDASKSDGAILSPDGNVIAVIELKDTTSANLGKVERQAFGYKHQHKDCRYIITSNFMQLRLYINDAIDFEAFDIFRLDKASFTLLYCCLQQKSLQRGVPLRMKQQSVAAEENVTRKLYDDYSHFKKQLFENITQQNPQYDRLLLFKKTQKLLDRFLFILFAEDRGLLPPNSVRKILRDWEQLKELDSYVPLYNRFKKYFGYMDTGYSGKDYEIFAYNGGLFAPDKILDNIRMDDELLFESCKALSNYDFESEIDVNILGHIFEHSLNEIEEIEQQLSSPGGRVTVSKRKKDGVFYTPRYITKYIVENTIGALCLAKKKELNFIDGEYVPQKRKARRESLHEKLLIYRTWLLNITICDPACGSGAFLNQALEFLIAEHQYIDTLYAKLFGDAITFTDVEQSILQYNLYGVDINEEAVEIARLSLWLRTARKGRALNRLNRNIKCGNSLINDPAVAGDKAFDWEKEFPDVFADKRQYFLQSMQDFKVVENFKTPPEALNEVFEQIDKKQLIYLEARWGAPITNAKEYVKCVLTLLHGPTDREMMWLRMMENDPLTSELFQELAENNHIPLTLIYEVIIENLMHDFGENFDQYIDTFPPDDSSGFDVVIGNPPYVRADSPGNKIDFRNHLVNNGKYETLAGKWDLYIPFIELSIKILNKNGITSLIIPDAYCHANYSKESLAWLKDHRYLYRIDYFPEIEAFENVGVKSIIINNKKEFAEKFEQRIFSSPTTYNSTIFNQYPNSFRIDFKKSLLKRKNNTIDFGKICYVSVGIVGNSDEKLYKGEFQVSELLSNNKDEIHSKLYFEGKDIGKWYLMKKRWIEYGTERSPAKWRRKGFKEFFEGSEKLVAMRSPGKIPRILQDREDGYFNESAIGFKKWIDLKEVENLSLKNAVENIKQRNYFEKISQNFSNQYLLCILNSKAVCYELNSNRRSNIHIYPEDYKILPVPNISPEQQQPFIAKADIMLSKNKELQAVKQNMLQLLQKKFEGVVNKGWQPSKKLQDWPGLSFSQFLKELEKQKIKLSLPEQAEWIQYFESEKVKANAIQQLIDQTDKEIDEMVYQLYGLTEEEIRVVEEG